MPPLDDLGVSAAPKPPPPSAIDRSSGLGAALSDTIVKELPSALAESKTNAAEQRRLATDTVARLDQDQQKRGLLQSPPLPPADRPPEPQIRSTGEAWGSIAMVAAMLGSAFTRRPMLNALNAGAEIIKAQRSGDIEAYRLNLDRWKQQSDYGVKLYEYQRDAYKDAIAAIESDQKTALSQLRVLAAALKDDPMHRLAEAGNVAGILSLEESRQTTMAHTRTLTEKAQREGDVTGEVLEAGKALRAAQQTGDPTAVAQATTRYQAAQQAAKDLHASHSSAAHEPNFGTFDDQMARWRGEFRTAQGREPTADEIKDRAAELKKAESTRGEYAASKEIAIVDKDGNVVERRAARESTTGPGWVDSATGKPITVPPGGRIDIGTAANTVMGTRDLVYTQRVLNAARTAVSDLVNVSKMGTGASSGVFGGQSSIGATGLLDASKRTLANQITRQQTQLYNAANAGVQRAFAQIESAGLSPGYHFSEQFNALTLQEGDTHLVKLYKLATGRQIVENGMEVIQSNPRLSPEQKKLATSYVDQVRSAIPWTTDDVIKLSEAKNPNTTLRQLGVKETSKDAGAAPGMTEAGNIDLTKRPVVNNPDGKISTVASMSFNENGREILIPRVAADGSRVLSEDEAIEQYRRTGQHLGKFDTPKNATAYAEQLHRDQDKMYSRQPLSRAAGEGGAAPPPAAIADLKRDPSGARRKQFDEIFGVGAAAKALGE